MPSGATQSVTARREVAPAPASCGSRARHPQHHQRPGRPPGRRRRAPPASGSAATREPPAPGGPSSRRPGTEATRAPRATTRAGSPDPGAGRVGRGRGQHVHPVPGVQQPHRRGVGDPDRSGHQSRGAAGRTGPSAAVAGGDPGARTPDRSGPPPRAPPPSAPARPPSARRSPPHGPPQPVSAVARHPHRTEARHRAGPGEWRGRGGRAGKGHGGARRETGTHGASGDAGRRDGRGTNTACREELTGASGPFTVPGPSPIRAGACGRPAALWTTRSPTRGAPVTGGPPTTPSPPTPAAPPRPCYGSSIPRSQPSCPCVHRQSRSSLPGSPPPRRRAPRAAGPTFSANTLSTSSCETPSPVSAPASRSVTSVNDV